jgi:histidine triad (HIT) family protein
MKSDCIFCLVIEGSVSSEKIFEDEYVFAFLDIHPINHGHTLVIPKEHHQDIFAIPADAFQHIMRVAHMLAPHVKEATGAEGINIGMNNGTAAGQQVLHSHVHVIPRFSNDGHKHWSATTYEDGGMTALGAKIRARLT